MATNQGTLVISTIRPFDSNDVFPSHEAQYGKGGLHSVADITARNAITSARREEGMLVYVQNEDKYYTLAADLTTWIAFNSGLPVSANSGGTISANGINFVNTSTVTVVVSPGIAGNANVSFASFGAKGIEIGTTPPLSTDILWLDTSDEYGTGVFGIPVGGSNNSLLRKSSSSDYSVEWSSTLRGYNEGTLYDLGTTGGTIAPDVADGNVQKITLNNNLTINNFTNPVAGQSVTIIIYGGVGYNTITSTMKFAGGDKTLTGTSGCIDMLSIYYDGTTYFASISKGFA